MCHPNLLLFRHEKQSYSIYAIPFLWTFAQVGIGTITPNAELEIKSNSTLPALELNPQTAPVGTATGQIAVIGDKLYMFDVTRAKWLSVEATMLNFGLENGTDNQFLEYVGDIISSGPKMPHAGTIVYVTMNASGGQSNKQVQLYRNNVAVPDDLDVTLDGLLQLSGYSFSNTVYNLEKGDHLKVKVGSAGSNVNDLSVLLWVKWRK